ncbi:MAG: S1C family serine protease, partial [Anaerolineae bacterium]
MHNRIDTDLARRMAEAMNVLVTDALPSVALISSGDRGVGTGIVWRRDGVLVTNAHVVMYGPRALRQVSVTLQDGRQEAAVVVSADPQVDLAVLRVVNDHLPHVRVGDSRRLRVGQMVFALGNPWGERNVATAGVISGLGEAYAADGRRIRVIRLDARLAPGNSGGPLLDAQGAVIGMNTLVVGGDMGVALPAHEIDALVRETFDRQVMLGVGVRPVPLNDALRRQAADGQTTGLLVVEIRPGAPAAAAGVQSGDLLMTLND